MFASPGQQGHPGENLGPRTLVPGLMPKTLAIPKFARKGEAAAREALEELCRRMDDGVQSNPGQGHPLYASWMAGLASTSGGGYDVCIRAMEEVQRELRPFTQGEADSEEDDSDEDLSFMESEVRSEERLRWWDKRAAKQVRPDEWREFEQGGVEETASDLDRLEMEQQWEREQALANEKV